MKTPGAVYEPWHAIRVEHSTDVPQVSFLRVDVETRSDLSAGQTVTDLRKTTGRAPNTHVCLVRTGARCSGDFANHNNCSLLSPIASSFVGNGRGGFLGSHAQLTRGSGRQLAAQPIVNTGAKS